MLRIQEMLKDTTINKEEVKKFSALAEQWWDESGKFKPLHDINPVRIKFIKDNIIKHFKINERTLENLKLLRENFVNHLITLELYDKILKE